jgi:hypothetical protein
MFESSISLLIFCLVIWSIISSGVLTPQTIIVELLISLFYSSPFASCVILLCTYMFIILSIRIAISALFWLLYMISFAILLPSNYVFEFKAFLLWKI